MEGEAYARALEEARKEFAAGVAEVMATSAGVTFVASADTPAFGTNGAPTTTVGRGVFRVPYLDRSFRVTYPDGRVEVVDSHLVGEATVAEAVIVLHYLARAARGLDLSDPVRFQGLPGAGAYVSAFRAHAEVPLIRRFGDDGRAYTAAARALGGVPAAADGRGEGRTSAGAGGGGEDPTVGDDPEVMWRLPFLPCLPMGVRLGLAEDGFPAECVIMFPRRAGFVQHVEDLAVAGEILSDRLLAAADAVAAAEAAARAAAAGTAGDEVVTLITVYDPVEAEIIVAKLRSAGIDAMVRHDALSVVYGLTVDGAGRSEVLVRAADLPEARGALQETSDGKPA